MLNCVCDIDFYLSVKKISEISGKSARTLQNRCKSNSKTYKYTYRKTKCNGGECYEILCSTLEPELQSKIRHSLKGDNIYPVLSNNKAQSPFSLIPNQNATVNQGKVIHINSLDEDLTISLKKDMVIIPEKAKKIALAKADLVNMWKTYRNAKTDKKNADYEFVNLYQSGFLAKEINQILGKKVSLKSLYRWNKDLLENGNDYKILIPSYKYSSSLYVNTKMSEIEQTYLLDLMLTPSKLSVGVARRLIKHILQSKGISEISSYATYKRFISNFKRNKNDIWTLMREGQKALFDRVVPYIERDINRLEVGDVLVADGHVLDFMVKHPKTGNECRATIVVYQDWKSADIAGYEIMLSENTQCIASALRNSIIRLGKYPKIAYQDNGRAFRGKFFKGCENLEDKGFYGLFGKIGVVPIFAKPYNGKSKPVERFFREFTQSFSSLVPSYIGNNIENKPAYRKRNEDWHKAIHNNYLPTIEETVVALEKWFEFYRSQPCPHVPGKTIGEVFKEGRGPGVNVDELNDFMMLEEKRTIGQNGIKLFNTLYYSPKLYGINDKAVVKYSFSDISSIKVYSTKGEFICTAETNLKCHPMSELLGDETDLNSYKKAVKEQAQLAKSTFKAAQQIVPRLKNRVAWQGQQEQPKTKKQTKLKNNKYTITCYKDIDTNILNNGQKYKIG